MWPSQTAFYHSRPRSPKFGEKTQFPSNKSNSDHIKKKGFVRLNSLESMASTTSSTSSNSNSPKSKSDLENLDSKMPPTAKEAKWFGRYQNDYQYQYQPQYWQNHTQQKWNPRNQQNQYFGQQLEQQAPESHYWPQQYQYQVPEHQSHQHSHYWPQYQYQVPYNLTKGQFEIMQIEAMANGIDQMSYCSQHVVYQGPQQIPNQCYYPDQGSGFSKCVNSFFEWGSALVSTLKETTTSFTTSYWGGTSEVHPRADPGVGVPEVPVSTPLKESTSMTLSSDPNLGSPCGVDPNTPRILETPVSVSSLNPNAQEFTPAKTPMGCSIGVEFRACQEIPSLELPSGHIDAKEIHSAEKSTKIVPDELQNHEISDISTNCNNKTSPLEKHLNTVNNSEPVTPPNEPEIELKAVNQRKCTPWISKGSIPKVSGDKNDTFDSEDIIEEDIDSDEEDADSDFEVESITGHSPRLRLISVCSSEDGIHFEGGSPNCQISSSPKYKIDKNKCSPFLKSFLAGPDDLSEEDSDNDDIEDDDDWDNISNDNQIEFDIDLEQFGLPSIPPMLIQAKSAKNLQTDEVDHNQLRSTNQNNINKKKIVCCEGDKFPTADLDLDYGLVLKKIKEANEKWDLLESLKTNQHSNKAKNVDFSEPLISGIQFEDPELADELRAARIGDYNCAQRRADQDRYNRLLGPIFNAEHRDKIRSYIAKQQSYLN